MAHEPRRPHEDTVEHPDNAREEVAETLPLRAPLPDPEGLADTLSPVDLPESGWPQPHPLRWTVTVIATACLVLALFNAHSIRGWAYDLKEGRFTQRITDAAEGWYAVTASAGLEMPAARLRGWWDQAKAARFPGTERTDQETALDAEMDKGPGAGAPEPSR